MLVGGSMKVAAITILLSALIVVELFIYIWGQPELDWQARLVTSGALFVSVATLLLTSVSTASNILLGWRSDRRAENDSALKTKQLELEIQELRNKLAAQEHQTISVQQPKSET